MKNGFAAWWHCRRRLRALDTELRAAGLQRRDPFYLLLREMVLLPDRLLLWLVAQLLIVLLVVSGLLLGASDSRSEVHLFPGTTADSRIVVLDAPGGLRWVNCQPGKSCLEIFLQPQRNSK